MAKKTSTGNLRCSFCGLTLHDGAMVIPGPGASPRRSVEVNAYVYPNVAAEPLAAVLPFCTSLCPLPPPPAFAQAASQPHHPSLSPVKTLFSLDPGLSPLASS